MRKYTGIEQELLDSYDEVIDGLCKKYDIMPHEVKDALKTASEDFGAKTFEEQVEIAEREVFAHLND